MIYHILPQSDWHAAQDADAYRGGTLDSEGFIHCSTIEQVTEVAGRVFHGRDDLLLLVIDPAKLAAPLKFEDGGHGDGRMFPHIYGPIEKEAVLKVVPFPPNPDGTFALPEELKKA